MVLMPGNPAPTEIHAADRERSSFLDALKSVEGDPYRYGAAGPDTFDCSGLIQWAAEKAGVQNVPRTSEEQWGWVQKINKSQLQPGDLIFSQWPGDNASPGHVQVYIGNGQVIQAPHTGATVSTASLSSDTGHIVGYGRIPAFTLAGQQAAFAQQQANAVGGNDSGGLLAEAGSLLHGVSEVLDFLFGFFYPGQGWRIAFGTGAVVTGGAATKVYLDSRGSAGGASFPAAVGLAGVATLFAFMALRTWPQEAGGPEKPGHYIAEILEGQPPPPGPKRVKETRAIEAGLGVFAAAWLAQKASSAFNSVITSVTSALAALGLIAAA